MFIACPVEISAQRLFLTLRSKRCAFGCVYCFAEFTQYEQPLTVEDVEAGHVCLEHVQLIYPACDIDLFPLRKHWENTMSRCVALRRSISISTKAHLTSHQVRALSEWDSELRDAGRVLKVGISASTKEQGQVIEPRAATWEQRLSNLDRLSKAGVASCLVLKPLLPEIELSEYKEMINDASAFTEAVLLGDEYVDDDRSHRRRSAADLEGGLSWRKVRWPQNAPHWFVREAGSRTEKLVAHARRRGIAAYLSDMSLMAELDPSWVHTSRAAEKT